MEAENWKTVNLSPKCARLHQIASQISKFSRGNTPEPPILGRKTPFAPRGICTALNNTLKYHTVINSSTANETQQLTLYKQRVDFVVVHER